MSAADNDVKGKAPTTAADHDPAFAALHDENATSLDDTPTHTSAPRRAQKAHNDGGLIKVQPLRKAEMQPSYAQDIGGDDGPHSFYSSFMSGLGSCIGAFGQIPCCFCFPSPFKTIPQGRVGLVSTWGRFTRAHDPGLIRLNVVSESLQLVDVRVTICAIPTQSIITKDNLSVEVDSVVQFVINNPYRAVYGVGNVTNALIERAQTTLRDVVGSRNLQSLISDREAVALQVEELVESVAEKWGVAVESILIKDIKISKSLQESLSAAATQRRLGESRIIQARSEVEAAKLLRLAANELASGPALQIRELDAMQSMAKNANAKVIFFPMHSQGQMPGGIGAQVAPQGAPTPAGGNMQQYMAMSEMAEQ